MTRLDVSEVLELIADGLPVKDADLSGLDFSGAALSKGIFLKCKASGTRFSEAGAEKALFKECKLDGSIWTRAKLLSTTFIDCLISEGFFDEAEGSKTRWISPPACQCPLRSCNTRPSGLCSGRLRKHRLCGGNPRKGLLRGGPLFPN